MKRTFVSDLNPGGTVDELFVIAGKKLRDYSKGAFLSFVLADRTGRANAVLWDEAEAADRLLNEGDLVRVCGAIGAYNGSPQIRIDRIETVSRREADLADFVETLKSPEIVEAHLREMLGTIEDPWIGKLMDSFLGDAAFMERFRVSSAARNWHHAFRGGLLKHTTELVELATTLAPLFPQARRDFLLAGAFLHDIGKVYEIDTDWTIDYSTIGKMLGHIVLGNQMALDRMREIPGFPAEHRMLLQHLILSHQGELEFASPVVPKTLEAILLHHLDDMNAKATAFMRVINETRERKQEWSEYQRLIARQIWAGMPAGAVHPETTVVADAPPETEPGNGPGAESMMEPPVEQGSPCADAEAPPV